MHSILKSYLKRLTNLSGNNRSLVLLRQSAEQDISLHALDHILPGSAFSIIESLIAGKEKISMCDVHDPRNADIEFARFRSTLQGESHRAHSAEFAQP